MRRPSSPGREVPRLHPGVNDLIRVLGKQAHCSSRTLISCEPNCLNTHSRSKYHQNCVSNKIVRNCDPLCRPSSLWSPIQLESYYYDCFYYRQYPDRDSEYEEILEKYNAIKERKLDNSPPDCDEEVIRAIISDPTMESIKSSDGKNTGISGNEAGPGTFRGTDYSSGKGEDYSSSSNKKKPLGSGSRRNLTSEGNSVPCSELAEIRDLLKHSDRETIRRMQEMLALMKELSLRDICRARCDGSVGKLKGNEAHEPPFMSQRSRRQPQKSGTRGQTEETDGCDDFEREESETWKPKRGGQDGSLAMVHSPGTAGAILEECMGDDMGENAAGQHSAEPVQYSNKPIKQLQGSSKKAGQDDECVSDESSMSEGRGGSGKGSVRKRKRKGHKGGSGSDTDPTESSSSLSECSTDGSRNHLKGSGEEESDLESSDTEDESSRSLVKRSSSKRTSKTGGKDELSSSETLPMERSRSSVCRSRPPTDHDGRGPRASKQSGISHKYISGSDQHVSGGNFKLTVGKYQLTVHEAVELANKITDIIALEMMDELIRKGLYVPPSIRYEPCPVVTDRPTSPQQSGGPPIPPAHSKVHRTPKAGLIKKLDRIDESSSRTGLSKTSLKKPAGSTLDTGKDEHRGSQQVSKKLSCKRHSRSLSPSAARRERSSSCRSEIVRERARSADYKKPRQPSETREPPKAWERRLSSQLKLESMKESSMLRKPESFRGSTKDGSQRSNASCVTNDRPSQKGSTKDGSQRSSASSLTNDRPSQRACVLEPLAESSKLSTATHKTNRSTCDDGNRVSVISRVSKTRPDTSQDGQRGISQYKTTTQDPIEIPRSRQSSKISQMSNLPGSSRLSKNVRTRKTQPETRHSHQGPISSNTPFDIHDKARPVSGGQQINQGINIQPTSVTQKEVDGGRVLSFRRTENLDVFVPETGSIKSLPGGPELTQISSACEPDDLNATTYDTDGSILYYARITRNAFPPVKESYNAAGFMLRSAYDYSIPPRNKVNVKTDLILQLPRNSYGRIAPRKCLVESHGIDVGADVIDRDFRGNITVVLFNHGDTTFAIKRGNKVAQLICESIHLAKVQENSELLKGC